MNRFDGLEVLFGEALRKLRGKKGMSQEKLAFECGIDRTFVSMLERGVRQPTLRTIFLLSEGLGVSPSSLISQIERDIGK